MGLEKMLQVGSSVKYFYIYVFGLSTFFPVLYYMAGYSNAMI